MSTPALIMWAVVLAVGITSAWRNPTALALIIAWLAGEAVFLLTGNNLPVSFYLFPDIFVLAVIVAKNEQLPLSLCDRIVALIYPVMWLLYVADVHPFYKWWALYFLAIAQFAAAGWESLFSLRSFNANPPDKPTSGAEYRIAWGRGYG